MTEQRRSARRRITRATRWPTSFRGTRAPRCCARSSGPWRAPGPSRRRVVAPVTLSGVTVTRASLHNVGFIDKLGLSLGAEVTLVRRGGVIPNVEFVTEPGTEPVRTPEIARAVGARPREKDFLSCSASRKCRRAVIGQIAHYAATCDMLASVTGSSSRRTMGPLRSPPTSTRCAPRIGGVRECGDKLAAKLVGR